MKQTLKNEILGKRKALSNEELREKSRKIKENLFSLAEFKKARNIMFYVSFNSEVDTCGAIKEMLSEKEKTIAVPYVRKSCPEMQLSELKNFDWLEPKTFGILEPKELYIKDFSPEKLDIVIVPGIAFDKKGYRIGYGHGYYDRFLKTLKSSVKKIGLAFEMQIVDKIPRKEYDVPVDAVVTEKRVLRCENK
jgi:5-formyltetrahydrofolate cyclo-ligase